jgi:hypothetical protein
MMTAMIVPMLLHNGPEGAAVSSERARVIIHIEAEILTADVAIHRAHTWLAENISHLLEVATPELVIGEQLSWRFEVLLALPNKVQPGSGALYRVGQMMLDAATGDIKDADALAAELRVHVTSIVP